MLGVRAARRLRHPWRDDGPTPWRRHHVKVQLRSSTRPSSHSACLTTAPSTSHPLTSPRPGELSLMRRRGVCPAQTCTNRQRPIYQASSAQPLSHSFSLLCLLPAGAPVQHLLCHLRLSVGLRSLVHHCLRHRSSCRLSCSGCRPLGQAHLCHLRAGLICLVRLLRYWPLGLAPQHLFSLPHGPTSLVHQRRQHGIMSQDLPRGTVAHSALHLRRLQLGPMGLQMRHSTRPHGIMALAHHLSGMPDLPQLFNLSCLVQSQGP